MKKRQQIKKSLFSKKSENFEIFSFAKRKKNAILLVLPIREISLQPELSSPPRFRIQGVCSTSVTYGRTDERKSLCLI